MWLFPRVLKTSDALKGFVSFSKHNVGWETKPSCLACFLFEGVSNVVTVAYNIAKIFVIDTGLPPVVRIKLSDAAKKPLQYCCRLQDGLC